MSKKAVLVYLEEKQNHRLKQAALKKGTTLSSLIREGVDLVIQRESASHDPAEDILDLGNSQIRDLGTRHDDYLVAELSRKTRK